MRPNTNLDLSVRVPILEIHEIEFSSRCNLACRYCPHPKMRRAKADMSDLVFGNTIWHLQYLVDRGCQGEVSLTGIGEAILHPRFVEWMHAIRRVLGARKLVVATNGVAMTPELAREMAAAKAEVFVSLHRPEVAGRAIEMLYTAGCIVGKNHAFVDSAIDWAGQVEWHNSAKLSACSYLQKGWAAVRQDGSVNTCCMDAESLEPIGHVNDVPGSLMTRATMVCAGCHLAAPKHFRVGNVWPEDVMEYAKREAQVAA